MTDTVCVIDIGTSSVRSARFHADGTLDAPVSRDTPPDTAADGVSTFDPIAVRDAAVDTATEVLRGGPVEGVGIAVQRASTVVWDPHTGLPLGPGLGWQDVRTVGRCLDLRAQGVHLAPNTTATKAEWLLDRLDPGQRARALVGTIDAWLVWSLTRGAVHATDATNAGVTGLFASGIWAPTILETLRIRPESLPRICDTVDTFGNAVALPDSPPIMAVIGDQQASMIGQGCVVPGRAKITFGTGGMLDLVGPPDLATSGALTSTGCYPLIAWQEQGVPQVGVEAIMLAAGSHLTWLRDGLGLIETLEETDELAASVDRTDGVSFVPALSGLGTPYWDHGARGTLLGLTRGTTRAHVVRAVLEGIANLAVDLVEAAEAATGETITELRVDGGMTRSDTFLRLVADAAQRPVVVSAEVEATARGAGLLAGVGAGWYSSVVEAGSASAERATLAPDDGAAPDRDRWAEAVERARNWIPELSALPF
ncbi:MAG TPA: FGGY-family carbohydrate kinase [Acidimicrobiales bacterium]|nr:FGGY-family carbohydrate kinase [Acidimicrobiales bacterium]